MTTDYIENESSKKKYLAPLVVVMLCAVALTGAAYASYATSVSGNGDIAGNYVVIDMYSDEKATTPSGVLQIDTSNLFKVYTQTDRTSDSKTPCVAKVDESLEAKFYTYLYIKTDLKDTGSATTTEKQFTMAEPKVQLIKLDSYKGQIAINEQKIVITDVETKATVDPETSPGNVSYTLSGNTVYKVEYTVTFKGNDSGGNFGSFADADAVVDAVAEYTSGNTKELTVMFTATEKA